MTSCFSVFRLDTSARAIHINRLARISVRGSPIIWCRHKLTVEVTLPTSFISKPQDCLDQDSTMGPLQEETTPEPLSLDGSSKHADIARLAVCDLSFTGLDQMLDREVNCFPVSVDASLMVEDEEESSLPGSMASSEERSSISNNETEVASIISDDDDPGGIPKSSRNNQHLEFTALRLTYLIVTLVIMLADGLQGKQSERIYFVRFLNV